MKRVFVFSLALLVVATVIIYYFFDPNVDVFLPCPFKIFTGYDCPGCGSQRALHYLLHFDFMSAFKANPIFVIFVGFGLLLLVVKVALSKKNFKKISKYIFSFKSVVLFLALILTFGILRNTHYFQILMSRF